MHNTIPSISLEKLKRILLSVQGKQYTTLLANSPIRVVDSRQNYSKSAILFSRYRQVQSLISNSLDSSKEVANRSFLLDEGSVLTESMLFKDDPEHKNIREFFSRFFKRIPVSRYSGISKDLSQDWFSLICCQGRLTDFELMSGFCRKLPISIMMILLGIPEEAKGQISLLVQMISHGTDYVSALESQMSSKNSAFDSILSILEEGLAGYWKSSDPRSPVSELQQLILNNQISLGTASSNIALLLFAGQETTAALLGSMIFSLASNPFQLDMLRKNRELVDSAIEEVLRFQAPLQRATFRTVTNSICVDNFTLNEGEELILMIGAANRDPEIFDNPNIFSISRSPNPHLSFGKGAYHCIGRQLAMVEAKSVCSFLLDRFKSWSVRKAVWGQSSLVRSLDTLYIDFTE